MKKTVTILYIAVIIVMAVATIVEHAYDYRIYDAWWFSALWALLAVAATTEFLKQRVRRLSVIVLHFSFIVILLGAFLTHISSKSGSVHLRVDEPIAYYMDDEGTITPLPFALRLDSFAIEYHPGTTAPADYRSFLTLCDESTIRETVVSMNNITTFKGIRLYQAYYDEDGQGTVLSVSSDPWGIPVTYTGYVLLFIGLVWILVDPKGSYRQLLRSPLLQKEQQPDSLLLKEGTIIGRILHILLWISFAVLTYVEARRWIIGGTIPMSNGYETMLVMAWFIQLFTLLLQRRFRILLVFGFLLSSFILLASHVMGMDSEISPVAPILNSPLLGLHVSVIMMSYALLSLTFICGVTALITKSLHKNIKIINQLALLSQLFLYPALTTLGYGIFIGAIWANISWGTYWSWDPKEVWALITLMVYGAAVHPSSQPMFRKSTAYHVYITLAFLSLIITYFGVNYILGGMHSYA